MSLKMPLLRIAWDSNLPTRVNLALAALPMATKDSSEDLVNATVQQIRTCGTWKSQAIR